MNQMLAATFTHEEACEANTPIKKPLSPVAFAAIFFKKWMFVQYC
jgi:hypothetical protein